MLQPRRLVRLSALFSLLATAPVLTIVDYIPEKESIILQYSLTAAGTIWCRAYREEEREYATVEGVFSGIQGIAAVAHVVSNYYIGNLEPNTDYYTFCVAEDDHQVAMSNSFESTERHVITLAGIPLRGFLTPRAALSVLSGQFRDLQFDFDLCDVERSRRCLQFHRGLFVGLRIPLHEPSQALHSCPRASSRALRSDLRIAAKRDAVRGFALRRGPQAASLGAVHRLHHLLHHHRHRSLRRRRRLAHFSRRGLRRTALSAGIQRRSPTLVRPGGSLGSRERRVRWASAGRVRRRAERVRGDRRLADHAVDDGGYDHVRSGIYRDPNAGLRR